MYARFTDRARLTMQNANKEAQRLNHEYIGTEHILLGLLKADGVGLTILTALNVDLALLAQRVRELSPELPAVTCEGKRPNTPRAKKVIEYAVRESTELNHTYIGTEHLLLGLIMEEEGLASKVLKEQGLTHAKIRATLLQLLDQSEAEGKESTATLLGSVLRSWHRRLGRNEIWKGFSEQPDADEQSLQAALRRWLAIPDNQKIESIIVVTGEVPKKETEPPPP